MTTVAQIPPGEPDPPYARSAHDVAAALRSDPTVGLADSEAARRLDEYGPNRPHELARPRYFRLALDQLLDPLVALLIGASVVSMAIGDTVEGAAIAAILVLNGILGFCQEVGAERAVRSLSRSFTQTAQVVRAGREIEVG